MDTNKSIVALEGNNGSRVYYADGTVEELPKEGGIYITDEIATSGPRTSAIDVSSPRSSSKPRAEARATPKGHAQLDHI